MGPVILFDKSFLQSLSVDESVLFDHFFLSIICPLFYVETLADLEKAVRQGRTPEQEVGIIVQKTPEAHGYPCAHHREICLADLTGQNIPMDGRIPVLGGKPVKMGDRRGVVFKEPPEAEAFRRWQAGEFLEIERMFAKEWRNNLNAVDLMTIAAGMRAMGINSQTCKSLEQAKQLAESFITGSENPLDRLKLTLLTLNLPLELEPIIVEKWRQTRFKTIAEHSPFAAYVMSVELFFQIALGANLISAERASNRVDIAYLSYLPFCMIFVSSDKLHQRTAPYFLRSDQSFVWGPDLKLDLRNLVTVYKSLPEQEQEKGLSKYARTPPQDDKCLITKLWNHHFGILRKQRIQNVNNEQLNIRPGRFQPVLSDNQGLVEHLNKFRESPQLSEDELDFDTSDPDMLSIERRIHKRRGSFWQLPKDLKSS